GLTARTALNCREQQRRRIEDRADRRDPRLVVVGGAEEQQDRIREMALEDLGRPLLPRLEDLLQLDRAVESGAGLKQRGPRGRRAGPRVERHDRDLAALEA